MKSPVAFPLHEFLADELASRDWAAADLKERCSIPANRVDAIMNGSRINFHEAEQLAWALGVSAALLLNLQLAYRKYKEGR